MQDEIRDMQGVVTNQEKKYPSNNIPKDFNTLLIIYTRF